MKGGAQLNDRILTFVKYRDGRGESAFAINRHITYN